MWKILHLGFFDGFVLGGLVVAISWGLLGAPHGLPALTWVLLGVALGSSIQHVLWIFHRRREWRAAEARFDAVLDDLINEMRERRQREREQSNAPRPN